MHGGGVRGQSEEERGGAAVEARVAAACCCCSTAWMAGWIGGLEKLGMGRCRAQRCQTLVPEWLLDCV